MTGDGDPTIEVLLAGLRNRSAVRALLERLGHAARPRRVRVAVYAGAGGDGAAARADDRAYLMAERAGLRVWLIELGGEGKLAGFSRWARRLREREPLHSHLFIGAAPTYAQLFLGCFGLEDELRHLVVEPGRVRASDVEAVTEMIAGPGEGGLALAARYARALDRTRVTGHFFRDLRAQREKISHAWVGMPAHAREERDRLALLFLCRMMFLYFLQRRGHLAGDPLYLANLLIHWQRSGGGSSFYRAVITPLFFGALNRRPADRDAAAAALGPLPYLNGGLFEPHRLERAFGELDLPDPSIDALFRELLERYRFTTTETADDVADRAIDAGIDPEMLGRVFEGLMGADRRGDTGTYYTPAATVDGVVREVLVAHLAGAAGVPEPVVEDIMTAAAGSGGARDSGKSGTAAADPALAGGADPEAARRVLCAARGLTVLDPACGSGAFLLAALSRIAAVRAHLGDGDVLEVRRDIVERALYGLDLQDDAALLCALRLWLALAVQADAQQVVVPPLPNLDRRVRQGDALIDPVDAGSAAGPAATLTAAAADPGVRAARRALVPALAEYTRAEPAERSLLNARLQALERRLAGAWLAAIERRLAAAGSELRACAAEQDFWGAPTAAARLAAAGVAPLEGQRQRVSAAARELEESGALPFFSFPVHFAAAAESGFGVVLSNPPWVRAHRWPAALGTVLRERYEVCQRAGWAGAAAFGGARVTGGQVDLALLFLERSLALSAPGGTLGLILPAKLLRSGYAGGARRMLLRETRLVSIEDHSLDQRSIFDADAFAATIVARRRAPASAEDRPVETPVRVTLVRRGVQPIRFTTTAAELPAFPDDPSSPWLLVPPDVGAVLRRMRRRGVPLGTHRGLNIRRGVVTGANEVMIVRSVAPKLGGLAAIVCTGAETDRPGDGALSGVIEEGGLRPLLRGSDVRAWRFEYRADLLWAHDPDTLAYSPGRRLRSFLEQHGARRGFGGAAPGRLQRLGPDTLLAKVAWQDIGDNLNAVCVPAAVRAHTGRTDPVVPLNTVYYVPIEPGGDGLLLAAFLNSLPLRLFARCLAERAKDARFRFFATTVAALPLPSEWSSGRGAVRLRVLSGQAHEAGVIAEEARAELDLLVARAYGLGPSDLATLRGFDAWLRGDSGLAERA